MNSWVWVLIGLGVLVWIGLAIWRQRRSYDHHLRPIVEQHGLAFVSSRPAEWGEKSPFPTFEIKVGEPQTRVGGLRGEYTVERVVHVRDGHGTECSVWAKLDFVAFRLNTVAWDPDLGTVADASGTNEATRE